jgi:AcrR family transcriptional regulator
MARDETERRLETAALTLLRHEGVLAGLNLRAVADAAGVNRGNVYHYFGSRRQLLQSALRRRLSINVRTVTRQVHPTLAQQFSWMFSYLIRQREAIDITALLVLDGDKDLLVMQFRDDILESLARLQASGEIATDVDLSVLHVYITALARGYVLHREHLAREVGRKVGDLDKDLLALALRMLPALHGPAADGGKTNHSATAPSSRLATSDMSTTVRPSA